MPVPHFSLRRRKKPRPPTPQQEQQPEQEEVTPRLPHERDQSADSQTGGPHQVIEQARNDIDRGIVDTDRRSAYGQGDDRGLKSSKH